MRPRTAAVALAVIAAAVAAWYFWPSPASEIRRRLHALAADVNQGASDGLHGVARAARIGTYFTDDVVIDLGQGTAPIEGRETLMGMVARLEPRTAQFRLTFEDVNVRMQGDSDAEVSLTAEIERQGKTPRDASMDAREFTLALSKVGADWRIARVRAVETIR